MGCSQKVEIAPWVRLERLERQIIDAVPPIDPPACNWLESDPGLSYCRRCAWEARWAEMPTIGPAPEEPDWFRRTDFEELLADGISAYMAGMPGESDHPESCYACGCTLDYHLTDYGASEELAHFEEYPIEPGDPIDGELTYALTRIFINMCFLGADDEKLASALKLAEATRRAIQSDAERGPKSCGKNT